MICTCPKCHGQIELDLPEVTEAGTTAACPACNGKFNVHRESFGGRALRKPHEISCASCGNQLGPELHCSSCGAQFPDYVVVSTGRRKVRRTGKKVKLKFSPFPQPAKSATQLPTLDMAMRPEAAGKTAPKSAVVSRLPKGLVIAISLLVLVIAAAAGTYLYQKQQAEELYAKNFVLASFCIQTGFERAQKASTRILAEWKEKTDAGQFYAPRPSLDDDRDFGIIGSKYDQALGKLSPVPEKFANSMERLNKLQGPYNKLRSLVMAPGNSQPNFAEAKTKIEAEYKQAIRDYRSGMPEVMLEKLTSESLKFKGLKVLLQ
jgi:uncharacterized protein YbaR (Trm112 family)